ncbi:MAG: acetyl/propionyl/methylcrotonyl-CoA carboxylase subunit alpha [Alphaproteobacteria bacterium]|nr:acetyl/propionyl/methylcrotonyl-CoA carboxylase subunit alpha [Alphaproteobacteria bacterium]
MFRRVLIANRGEIACRIMRTARRLGIAPIAVYSDADADAMHVALADEAYRVGPDAARDSYLAIDNILQVAADSKADAIHPGYGFLSENADFAEACAEAGLTFVGPPAAAIRTMGSKIEAKRVVEAAGVPVVPGYHGASQSRSDLRKAAETVGYPLLIKASAGGGGRGMRIVESADGFDDALDGASREAKAAFGDGRVLLERYVARPRHVEIQVFGDNAGNFVHLFERDCSVQRRYQKILEESPAPGLSDALRQGMATAAVEAARAVAYVGAGTVEFIVDCDRMASGGTDAFYFLEMNTRLQVEHPVTEMVTGVDLVEWQFRVAAGEPLPADQGALRCQGHAVEARLYAEDPRRNFLPSVGTLGHLRFAPEDDFVRVDTGFRSGDTVSRHYDPMIAKVIAKGADRATALDRLAQALRDTEVVGLASNREFLLAVLAQRAFRDGHFDTHFVDGHRDALLAENPAPFVDAVALAAVAELDRRERAAQARVAASADPYSPWNRLDSWRLVGRGRTLLRFREGETPFTVRALRGGDHVMLGLRDRRIRVTGAIDAQGAAQIELEGRRVAGRAVRFEDAWYVFIEGRERRFVLEDALRQHAGSETAGGKLTAPLPATVAAVHVRDGQRVSRGDALMVLEAMKMEHVIAAPSDCLVAKVNYAAGEQVDEGAELIVIDMEAGKEP